MSVQTCSLLAYSIVGQYSMSPWLELEFANAESGVTHIIGPGE